MACLIPVALLLSWHLPILLRLSNILYSLSKELHANSFEIVPVQFDICNISDKKTKCMKDQVYQQIRRSLENECDRKLD